MSRASLGSLTGMPYCLHTVTKEAAMPRIAFYTFGLIREPFGHPDVKDFEDRIQEIAERLEEWDGFIQLQEGWEPFPRFADPAVGTPAPTVSLWRDLASVHAFSYHGLHADA